MNDKFTANRDTADRSDFESALSVDRMPDPDVKAFPISRARAVKPSAVKSRHPLSWLLISQLVIGLLVAVGPLILVIQLREHTLTAAEHELRSLSLTLANQAERAFVEVDLVQTTFMEMARTEGAETPEAFRKDMSSEEVYRELTVHGDTLPQLEIIGLMDTEGKFINVSHTWPVPAISIGDRPYFLALRADQGPSRVISDPLTHRVTHTEVVAVAHRVTSSDGVFLGVSVGGMRMSYFEDLYRTVATDADMAISLFRTDGVLLARYPRLENSVGKLFAEGGVTGAWAGSGTDSEVTLRTSLIDGVERLIASHKLAHYPLVVSVSTTASSILAPWRKQAVVLIGAAGILELALFGVGVLMHRQLRSQRLLGEARATMAEAEIARRADKELQIQAVRFGAALSNMSEVLCLFDVADRLVVGNDRLASMLDIPAGSITTGMTLHEVGAMRAEVSGMPSKDPQLIHDLIISMRAAGRRESQTLDLDDGRRIAVNYAPMENGGWLVTLEDITEQRRTEARIAHMAHHDALTGLANRLLFHERLRNAMARSRRGERFAVLYLDLDHFKAVNDTLGHPVGDALLREVTQRLKLQVREIDIVARLGGDEFAIVQSINQPGDSTALATRLIDAVSAPYEFNGNRVMIGTSIGIALVPDDGEDVDEVIKSADVALYRSKALGRGRYQLFEAEMNAQLQARRTLDLGLRKALAEGEFRMFYQPLVHIATNSVCGFEALIRWQHPQRGLISPADFIPLAEEIGLIVPMGRWALRQACTDAATWPDYLKVAVNLSPVQFGSPTLVEDVAAALADHGVDPDGRSPRDPRRVRHARHEPDVPGSGAADPSHDRDGGVASPRAAHPVASRDAPRASGGSRCPIIRQTDRGPGVSD